GGEPGVGPGASHDRRQRSRDLQQRQRRVEGRPRLRVARDRRPPRSESSGPPTLGGPESSLGRSGSITAIIRGVGLPPGPREPAFVQSLEWTFAPAAFMERCAKRYGDPFTARLPGFGGPGQTANVMFVSDPAAIKAVFTGGPELARVFDSRQTMAPVLGLRSILLVDGTEHL